MEIQLSSTRRLAASLILFGSSTLLSLRLAGSADKYQRIQNTSITVSYRIVPSKADPKNVPTLPTINTSKDRGLGDGIDTVGNAGWGGQSNGCRWLTLTGIARQGLQYMTRLDSPESRLRGLK